MFRKTLAAIAVVSAAITPVIATVAPHAAAAPKATAACKPATDTQLFQLFMTTQNEPLDQVNAAFAPYCLTDMTANTPTVTSLAATAKAAAVSHSDHTDMTVDKVTIFKDVGKSCAHCATHHRYSAYTNWTWDNKNYTNENGNGGENENEKLGGEDGFAIAMNTKLDMRSFHFFYCGLRLAYNCTTDNKPDSSSSYGAGFREQDMENLKFSGIDKHGFSEFTEDNNMYSGGEELHFVARSGCVRGVQGFAKYGHNWSSSGITGIAVGEDSIGFDWTNQDHAWTLATQPSNSIKVCRHPK